jgi:hypothetical protein
VLSSTHAVPAAVRPDVGVVAKQNLKKSLPLEP